MSEPTGKGWDLVRAPNGDRHVVAFQDLEAHTVEGLTCPCEPFARPDDSTLIIHNAFDGRDIIERLEAGEAP